MLDINMFREQSDVIKADHDRRGLPHDAIEEVISLDEQWRKAISQKANSVPPAGSSQVVRRFPVHILSTDSLPSHMGR